MANKLKARMRAASLIKEMTLEGVIGIVEGLNPTLIRLKLTSYDDRPKPKPKAAKEGKPAKAEAAPKPAPAA
jgi:chemotaxis protein MotA